MLMSFITYKELPVKRDMDFIRDLLLKIEGGQKIFETASTEAAAILGFTPDEPLSRENADKLSGYLDLLEEAGFIEIEGRMGGGSILVKDRVSGAAGSHGRALAEPDVNLSAHPAPSVQPFAMETNGFASVMRLLP